MVEGHSVHRVCHQHRRALAGLAFRATSPNGRFAEGAAAIDGKVLERVEAIGKNLLYFFGGDGRGGTGEDVTVMHVHFGMSGRFGVFGADSAPEPKPTTRLQLQTAERGGLIAHLSAMTVQHGGIELFHERRAALGEDPLRDDADPGALRAKAARSSKPVGLLLMDQAMMAGVGNIYRAEILWRSKLHPEMPCSALTDAQFAELWRQSVRMLRKGFECGSIITVDDECGRYGAPWSRRYIYNQKQCPACKGPVRSWSMSNRTVYCCETCQPLDTNQRAALPAARAKALGAARGAKLFASHCAPDRGADVLPEKMRVAELRSALDALGLNTQGKKADLLARLLAAERTGTAGIVPKSAAAAAAEKLAAGESRAVEHIAELDDEMAAVIGVGNAGARAAAGTPARAKGERAPARPRAGVRGVKRARRSLK
eukprot:PRCOL_00004786-RA